MEWSVISALIYGALGGLFEFLPVSPEIHQKLMLKLTGLTPSDSSLSLAVHIGALLAMILACYGKIGKLYREQKIAALPHRHRKRQPDTVSLIEIRLLKTAGIPAALSCFLAAFLQSYLNRFWLLAILVFFNGIVIALPQYMTRANKDTRSVSPLDVFLMGLSGVIGMLPGFSRMGVLYSVGAMRGMDRQYCLDFTYILAIAWLAALCVVDIGVMVFSGGVAFTGTTFFNGVFACVAAFGAGFGGIQLMRFLIVKNDLGGFAYYNWGLAMFAFIFYLIG